MTLEKLNQMLVETGVVDVEPELTAQDILNEIKK